MNRMRAAAWLTAAVLSVAACSNSSSPGPSTSSSSVPTSRAPLQRFPSGGIFDYQIGGAYRPAADVRIVDRDQTSGGAIGTYNICYINAYQAQPDQLAWWQQHHPTLLLHDGGGHVVMDRDWNEALLDISTPAKRAAVAEVVSGWITDCARAGFDAVEPDNLDSYTRSQELLTSSDALAFARQLAVYTHGLGLLIGQKNAAELAPQLRKSGYDFAIAEECQAYAECGAYTSAYGKNVVEIEYAATQFNAACAARRGKVSLLLRDRGVVPKGKPGYVDRVC